MERRINLTGKTFDRLEVVGIYEIDEKSNVYWKCICSCGNETIVRGHHLTSGRIVSCGCYRKEQCRESRFIDLTGRIFGKLIVLYYDGNSSTGDAMWMCQCECGNKKSVRAFNLVSGTSSCGCLRESLIATELKLFYYENYSGIIEYKIFRNPETNSFLPFDIFIGGKKDIFIEINGIQHYEFVKYYHKTKEKFAYNKKLDRMKRKFARNNGIYVEIDLRKIKTTEKAIEIINNYL